MKHKLALLCTILMLLASACAPQPAPVSTNLGQAPITSPQMNVGQSSSAPAQATSSVPSAPTVAPVSNNAPHVDVLDPTHLPVGDGKISSSPQRGYVYSCITQFNGGGAQVNGPWFNNDGTWDLTKKISVQGSVTWPHSFNISVNGDQRVFTSNDLPDHPTGNFPVSTSDPAYQVDRNPNTIQSQSITLSIPANPTIAAQPTCVGGMVGIITSGVLIFSAFDAGGRDAAAHEVQDSCNGHPQESGIYHYHDLSPCIKDNATGQSALLGYALDGFGIYGPYDANGKELTNADLDECHGITSQVEWDGKQVVMYHYVATREFPYVVGCFRGTPSMRGLNQLGGGQSPQPGNGQQPPTQSGPQGQQPPQAAIDACVSLSQNATCSFTAQNGQTISGTCQTPPQTSQLVCVPAGGPPRKP